MTAVPIAYPALYDLSTAVEVHVLGVLHQDLRTWSQLLIEAARRETLIPRSKLPHIHPYRNVPCMFCAASVSDIHTVSASIILSLTEARNVDDMWNASDERTVRDIIREAQKTVIDDEALEGMFGEHWGMVISLGFRVEMADAAELVNLLRTAMGHPETLIAPRTKGRDFSHTARWLISSAMSGKREVTLASRMRQRGYTDRLSTFAALVAREGTTGDDTWGWIPATRADNDPVSVQKEVTALRVVR